MAVPRGRSGKVRPNRPLPSLHLLLRKHREGLLQRRNGPVLTTFAQEQNVLDVVSYDSTGLVGFSVESRAVSFSLGGAVGDLVPKDRLEAIEAEASGADLDIRMRGTR